MFKKRNLLLDLTEYLRKNLRKGYTKESLRWALLNQGYSKLEIEKALQRADKELADEAPILKTKPEIEHKITPLYEDQKPKKSFFGRWF